MEPYDDEDILDVHLLVRRVNPLHHLVTDHDNNCKRLSTKAFSPSSQPDEGMSVDLPHLIAQNGFDPQEYVTTPVYTGAVSFTAKVARSVGLKVGGDPLPENPYHAQVWGGNKPNRFSRSQQKTLMACSSWFVAIPGVKLSSY